MQDILCTTLLPAFNPINLQKLSVFIHKRVENSEDSDYIGYILTRHVKSYNKQQLRYIQTKKSLTHVYCILGKEH